MIVMQDNSTDFYARMPAIADFAGFSDHRSYHPVPDDWCVVITDVRNSTGAIARGKYKQVNAVGVASIVALRNAVEPFVMPYAFGGDGAVACMPVSLVERARPALAAARLMAQQQFGLQLYTGIVPLSDIRSRGHDVLLARYQPHPGYQQAFFSGDGMAEAERLVKQAAAGSPWLVEDDPITDNAIFDGFECRWNEVPTPFEENVALIVRATGGDTRRNERIYAEVLTQIGRIYGEQAQHHPLREENLSLATRAELLSVEAGVRSAFAVSWLRQAYRIGLGVRRLLGDFFMRWDIRLHSVEWGRYKRSLIANTDVHRFDDMLRMMIAGSPDQRVQLRSELQQMRDEGLVVFGMHASTSSIITCIVGDYQHDHVHFLDGADGGYTLAAGELKAQLRGH